MYLHENMDEFRNIIQIISDREHIDSDIIEKDYYVCLVLKELAKEQEYLKAYFKGGTAVYKILDTMNRFSEDIDLTVEVLPEESNNSNKTRLKKSALSYKIPGLELDESKTKDVKQSVTAFYQYHSLFGDTKISLHKAGEIQVEATSFTVSEPIEIYEIEPIIYKYANENERKILTGNFEISSFKIRIQKLERIFVDKLFAAEMYLERGEYIDLSKHIYDLTILFGTDRIQNFLSDEDEFNRIVFYKRKEELVRKGGVDADLKIKDFGYFTCEYTDEMLKAFNLMQDKYIFKEEYRRTIEETREVLTKIREIVEKMEKK